MFSITSHRLDFLLPGFQRWLPSAWRISAVLLAIVMSIEVVAVSAVLVWDVIDRPSMPAGARAIRNAFTLSDATALTEQAARNLLAGKNPYTTANIVSALNASPEVYDKLTPLRTGRLNESFPYPSEDELKAIWSEAITNLESVPPEIESKFNYPAGSFLLAAPFMAIGISDIRIVYLLFSLPALAFAAWRVHPGGRRYFIMGVILSIELWNAIFSGDISLLYLPFVLVGWLLLKRNFWLSAVFMGIAMATKQTAWFFFPFYLIYDWRAIGLRKAVLSGMVIAGVFFAMNLPFVLTDPELWVSSILAPMADPLFPLGAGVISFVIGGVLRLESSLPFTILEMAVLGICVLWYSRNARLYPHTGLILALVPLFFAWRSLWDYFYYADIILLAAILVDPIPALSLSESRGVRTPV
jgi:hypothetical protein